MCCIRKDGRQQKLAQLHVSDITLEKYLLGWVILRNKGHLKVGANQLSPKVLLAVFSTDAFPHKVYLIDDDLT